MKWVRRIQIPRSRYCDSMDAIAMLDEDRLKSFYWLQELQQRRKRQKDVFSRAPKFVNGDLVIIFTASIVQSLEEYLSLGGLASLQGNLPEVFVSLL